MLESGVARDVARDFCRRKGKTAAELSRRMVQECGKGVGGVREEMIYERSQRGACVSNVWKG